MSACDQILDLKQRMGKSIIGQDRVIERLLIGLLANADDAIAELLKQVAVA